MGLVVLLVIALLVPLVQAANPDVTPLSFAGESFREAFNAARSQSRLVVILSPT